MKKWYKIISITLAALYCLQLFLILYINVYPYDIKKNDVDTYIIKLGMGNKLDYLPVVGALSIFTKDLCRLIIEGTKTRKEYSYDLPEDIYRDCPEIWPGKQ